MSLLPLTFPPASTILISGAGGGFDFLCGLPIALELQAQGHTVHIANYSFTALHHIEAATWHRPGLLEVTAASSLPQRDYFPEGYLAQWFRHHDQRDQSIWCFDRLGLLPLLDCYNDLISRFSIDAVICVDGGVDGLFRGDEHDLGTPSMDSISVIATSLCHAPTKLYVCTAFGTEGTEGNVSHAQALHRLADLMRDDALLGVGMMLKHTAVGQRFIDATHFIFERLAPIRRSIIVSTLLAAMHGKYGHTVVQEKTRDRPPWISPLTALLWYCDAVKVAQMKLFYEAVQATTTVEEVAAAIEHLRQRTGSEPYESIPI